MTSSNDSVQSHPTEAENEDSSDEVSPEAVPAPKPKPAPPPLMKLSLSFGDWKRKKEAQTQRARITPQPPMTTPWLHDGFRQFAPPMQPPPPPPSLRGLPKYAEVSPLQPLRPPPQPLQPAAVGQPCTKPTSQQLPQAPTPAIPLQKLQPQIYVPRPVTTKYKVNNNAQKSAWMLKPPVPPPMTAISPESREEKQRLWREYRQAMKPFKNREFANAKRTIQRLSKKSDSELDEKEQARLERAQELVTAHKTMLSQKAALRAMRAKNQLVDTEQCKTLSSVGAPSSNEQHGNGISSAWQKERLNAADSCTQLIGGQRDFSTGLCWGAESGDNVPFPMRNFVSGGTWSPSTGSMTT